MRDLDLRRRSDLSNPPQNLGTATCCTWILTPANPQLDFAAQSNTHNGLKISRRAYASPIISSSDTASARGSADIAMDMSQEVLPVT